MSALILGDHRSLRAQAEEDESSAHTSAAAVDSDDVGCMEDTMFHGDHDQDDVDFHFPMEHEQRAGSVTPTNVNRTEIAILPPYPDGVTSPPPTVTVGYESLADLSHGHDLSSAIAASSGFVCTRRSPSSQELGGGVAWEAGGCGIESACEATGVGKVRAVLIPPPSREEQHAMMKELVMDQESRKLEPGERRYLLSLSWTRRWADYVGWNQYDFSRPMIPFAKDPPGPITNEDILTADGTELKEYHAFALECVTQRHWDLVSGWYGGVPIVRSVIMSNGSPTVEMYPLRLTLETGPEGNRRSVDIFISKSCTAGELRRRGTAVLQLEDAENSDVRLWIIYASSKYRELRNDSDLLSEVFLTNKATILFEVDDGAIGEAEADNSPTRGSTTTRTALSTAGVWNSDYFSSSSRRSCTPGAAGLNNLGNTCFMNAAIQCLSHIPQVREYFGGTEGKQPFLQDINTDNPLGTKGALARAFGDLVRRVWEGRESCIYPRDFREVLCNHAEQFLGYDQHDSQEFLAYLLDGIHEDVNRVRQKPFVESVEANGGEDDETAARRAWDAHLKRNDSFVVDTMHGQYKSVVTCPVEGCNRTSTTFDPAMYLSVPLPTASDKNIEVILATLDGCPPKRYCLLVPKSGRVRALRQALSKACGLGEDRLILTDIWQHNVQTVLKDDDPVSTIRMDDTTVAYQLPEWGPRPPAPVDGCHCCQRRNAGGGGFNSSSCTADDCGVVGGGGAGSLGSICRDESSHGTTGGAGASGIGWEPKLSPFLLTGRRSEELRKGGEASGRFRLLQRATRYLDRFPPQDELEESESTQNAGTERVDTSGDAPPAEQPEGLTVQQRLRRASEHPCAFTELDTPEAVGAFGDAVSALRAVVVHEQREVKVQITQLRAQEYDSFGGIYRKEYGSYNRFGTLFSFPLVLSYLPQSTTVGEFRSMVALMLRRHVVPRDAEQQGDAMDLEAVAEEGAVDRSAIAGSSTASTGGGTSTSSSPRERHTDFGPGDPGNMLRLIRSGELQLLTTSLVTRQSLNVFDGGDERADDLLSNWIEEGVDGLTKLDFFWSADALREAYDSAEAGQVEDDASVAESRDRGLAPLSVRQCLDHFLQREQLDETEMWYCSNCKEHRRAYKELSLWRLPPVLIVHLKRFSYDTTGGWSGSREKIHNLVTFPVRGLDMRDLEHAQPRPDAVDDCSTNSSSDRDAVVVDCCAKPVFSAKSTTDSTCDNSTSSREDYPMNDWVLVRPQHEQERASSSGTGESVDAGSVDGGRNSYQPMVQDSSRADTCRDCERLMRGKVNVPNVPNPPHHPPGVMGPVTQGPTLNEEPRKVQDGDAIYDLSGIVNHYGGLGGGHYTAFARNEHDNCWYEMSDDRVSAVESEGDLVTSAAYVLFYQRRRAEGTGETPGSDVGGVVDCVEGGGLVLATPTLGHEHGDGDA